MSRKLNRKNPAADETSNSYEKKRSSYDAGRRSASKKKFLAAHQLGATTRQAARIAGVCRGTLYRWRNQDPEFALAWLQSRDKALEDLEILAFKRAIQGNDRLLMFLLKSHMPDTYNQRSNQPKPAGSKALNIADLVDKVREWI